MMTEYIVYTSIHDDTSCISIDSASTDGNSTTVAAEFSTSIFTTKSGTAISYSETTSDFSGSGDTTSIGTTSASTETETSTTGHESTETHTSTTSQADKFTSTESSATSSFSTADGAHTTDSKRTEMDTTQIKTSTPEPRTDNVILAVCLTFFIIVLIIFAIVLYFYCTKKDFPCMNGKNSGDGIISNDIGLTRKSTSRPKYAYGHMFISEEDFETQHHRKIADDGRGYREEYRAVLTEGGTLSAARDPLNAQKNRYDNVLPWDSTRVLLSVPPNGNATDDYVNANYVPGYLQEKKFIACQGPKETTCADFWKMIWEQKSATIVMVTNLIEAKKPKCHQYWPGDENVDSATATYGSFTVTLADVKIRNFYIMRIFKLQFSEYPSRIVRQLHYIAWPDFGVPKNPHELLLFRRRVIATNPPHAGPIVVHCSAGVGRTGTYIVIDAAMEQLNAEGKVDLFSFLTKMRKYRMMLVQTDAQYAFAHAAILEHIKYGDTEVPVKKFRSLVQSIRETRDDSEETVLESQFSTLLKIPPKKDNMKHGRQSIKKNRVLQIIPYDENRVTLPLKPGQEKSDYINASFIDGFKDKKAYIATQGPLDETANDFWSMIWMHQVQNIVMLTGLVEKGQQMCAQYWPQEMNAQEAYGDISVQFVGKDDDDVVDYAIREFILTNPEFPGEERKVRQYHFNGWPEVGLPTDAHGLIEIANRLSCKDKDGHTRPTAVHCSSGGGRTGVFIGLNILMESADREGMVDLFQTVKSLRAQRPHIIQTQEQFYFLYIALLQYLENNQVTDDCTTLTSTLNLSVENHSQLIAHGNDSIPSSVYAESESDTPKGSMNNKLDYNSELEKDSEASTVNLKNLPDHSNSSEYPGISAEAQSSETQSGDSVNQALLDERAANKQETAESFNNGFEVVNETMHPELKV